MKVNMRKKNIYNYLLAFFGVVILVLGALFFAKILPFEMNQSEAAAEHVDGWYYFQNNKKIPFSLPFDMTLKGKESVEIYNDTISSDIAGKYLFVKNAIYRPQIYFDGKPLYQYDDGGLRRNPPELSYQICKANIPENVQTGTLKIIYQKSTDDTISLPMVYTGDADTITRMLFFSNAYITVITIMMIMLGIFILLVEILAIKQNYEYKKKLLMIGFFLLTVGVWCLSDSPLVQYLLGYSNVNMYADFFIFMFLLIPFIGYVKSLTGMEQYRSLAFLIIISLCNAVMQTVLALLDIFTYIMMVSVTHFLIVVGVLTSIFLLFREYSLHKNREIFLCLRAFAIAGIFGVFSILLYFLKPEIFYQNFFQTGLLLFVLILLWNVVSEFIESLKYKAQVSIYKQLSEADKLTNLKNRRGFDLKISEIEKNAEKYDNVLLIFIDVNGLKRINDTYGHTKGDEAIIAAANCIQGAYHNHGFCFRIGGDEFCAIIENPLFSEQDAVSFVEHEVEKYNQTLSENCHFSVAIGCSLLKDTNGNIKSIAKWKEEADYKMYEDKKKRKFQEKGI